MDTTFLLTVGGVTSFDDVLQRPAQSIVVSNFSNQWVELPGITQFVPPYWVGATFPAEGTNRAVAKFNSPIGIPQAAAIAAQACVIVYMEIAIQPNPGQPITVRAPSTERRNPTRIVRNSGLNNFGQGTAAGTDWTYTVPAGRRFIVESAQVMCEITTAFSANNLSLEASVATAAPGSGVFVDFLGAIIGRGSTAVGARADGALASTKELIASEQIAGLSGDRYSAGPGFASYLEVMTGTEFDA